MSQMQKTWRERWDGFWEKQKQAQFEVSANGFGLFAGIVIINPVHPSMIGFLIATLAMVAANLWRRRLPYRRPIAGFLAGMTLMISIGPGRHRSIDPSVINASLLAAFIVSNFLVIFANIGGPIKSNVQRGLEILAWGMVISLVLLLGYAWLRPGIPWYVAIVAQWLCLVTLHAGTARAGGLKPNWPYVSSVSPMPLNGLETQ